MDRWRHGRLTGPFIRGWERTYLRRQQVGLRITNPTHQSIPVFLVGCGRSGTNMLVRRLSRSWQVDTFNEGNPAAFDNWRIKNDQTIQQLVQQSHTPIVLFKPILDTFQARRFLEAFDKAKIIFAYRHYTGVVDSGLRRFGENNWNRYVEQWVTTDFVDFAQAPLPEATKQAIRSLWRPDLSPAGGYALYWLLRNRLYFDLELIHDTRVKAVQYEQMVRQPKQEFRELCRWLGIFYSRRFPAGIHTSSLKKEVPNIPHDIRQACNQLWDRLSN